MNTSEPDMSRSNPKRVGLFLNTPPAPSAIHESGKMVYQSLLFSDAYELDYLEVTPTSRLIPNNYDFYFFNYHISDMGWLDTKSLRHLSAPKITLVLEVLPNQPFFWCPADDFDAYCVLDPTMNVVDKRVYAMPRTLEVPAAIAPYHEPEIPVIGSFGFATPGKGFETLVDAVNREFEQAIVRINIPKMIEVNENHAWKFHKRDHTEYLRELCEKVAKPGVKVVVTQDFMTKDELIDWCAQNTLNCFLYSRFQPGLAATTDQAISSGRPLAVSTNQTFRHIHRYIQPYPLRGLRESIATSQPQVLQMQKDWHPANFSRRFEEVLADLGLFSGSESKQAKVSGEDFNPSPDSLELQVREPAIETVTESMPEPRRTLLTEVRARLSLKYRLRKVMKLELPVAPKLKLDESGTLKRELAEVRRVFHYFSEVGPRESLAQIVEERRGVNTVLLVSHKVRQRGTHEYGENIADALRKSSEYSFLYLECSHERELRAAIARTSPSAIIYNYDSKVMAWLTGQVTRKHKVPQFCIMHEVTQEEADRATQEVFDYYLCPDPTLEEHAPFVFKTARLIPPYLNYQWNPDIVTIGSFGFGAGDKGFERLVSLVQEQFDEARIRLHMPFDEVVDKQGQEALATAERCRSLVTKAGIQLDINHEFLTRQELLDFLAGNTLNAFLYDTSRARGIASTTDFALAVQRPIAVNRCPAFRHLNSATPSVLIEDATLTQIIGNGIAPLVPLYNDWSEARFIMCYERILDSVLPESHQVTSSEICAAS
jgi:hypothetical protein